MQLLYVRIWKRPICSMMAVEGMIWNLASVQSQKQTKD